MENRNRLKALLSSPLLAAILGGGVVAGALIAAGVGDKTTVRTVVVQAPISQPASARSRGLTPGDIYRQAAPGVVNVRSQIVRRVQSPFDFFPQEQQGEATGSGFVLDKSGHILTNAHVIAGASRVTVQFEDNKTADAKVVGKDSSSDLALLKVSSDGHELHPLKLGDSSNVQVGDPTIAIGNPFGLDRTLTTGVVSALQRRIEAPSGFSINHVIQTDAAINPGNSGGPLLDATGRVIGINSQIATGGSGNGNVGIGFAVPINTAKEVIPQLERSGSVSRAYLGITGLSIDASLSRLNLATSSGVLVQKVASGSPAAHAGIRGGDTEATVGGTTVVLGGDVIKKVDGKRVRTMDDVVGVVDRKKPGETIKLELLRDGKTKTVTAKLAQRPDLAP